MRRYAMIDRKIKNRKALEETLNWMDGISIGAFAVIGANNGMDLQVDPRLTLV
jgi:uncharacterized membrane protein YeiH